MGMRNSCSIRFCKCCKTKQYWCEYCEEWYVKGRKDQNAHGAKCKMRRLRAKTMMTTKDGKKVHVLSELLSKDKKALIAYQYYDKSKREWFYELKPVDEVK
jgi:hypothetical protein